MFAASLDALTKDDADPGAREAPAQIDQCDPQATELTTWRQAVTWYGFVVPQRQMLCWVVAFSDLR